MSVQKHYESHLARFYEWMTGDFDVKQKEQQAFFEENEIKPIQNGVAIDLGSGHGLQSVSLAKLGFSVRAIDSSEQLLANLRERSKAYKIETVKRDLLAKENFKEPAEVIVCMGDTVSHLESFDDVQLLFSCCFQALIKKGKLILSFRDYSAVLTDTERFIPVKSDENLILTCFLEYMNEKVRVTDLLYEKSNSKWMQRVGSYDKLRITSPRIETLVTQAGFNITVRETINRLNYLIAVR